MTPTDKVRAALDDAFHAMMRSGPIVRSHPEVIEIHKKAIDACAEALSALDGMVLVPIDPTEAMKWAVVQAPDQILTKNPVWNEECYRAMIAPYVKGENNGQ